jgi:hypothetical protein
MTIFYKEIPNISILAGAFFEMHLPVQYIGVLESTASGNNLEIEAIDENEISTIRKGIAFSMASSVGKSIRIWNRGGTTITVDLAISDTIFQDNRLVFTSALPVTGGDSRSTPASKTAPATTATVLVATNTARTELTVQNNGTVDIRVGDSGITPTRGVRVLAGGEYSTKCKDALYSVSEGASNTLIDIEDESIT